MSYNWVYKYAIGQLGRTSTTSHIIVLESMVTDGKELPNEPFAKCKPNNSRHYRIGVPTNIKQVEPTTDNITCKTCLKHLEGSK